MGGQNEHQLKGEGGGNLWKKEKARVISRGGGQKVVKRGNFEE